MRISLLAALLVAVVVSGLVIDNRLSASPATAHAGAAPLPLTRFVDPFIGTGGAGNLFPGADMPFGMAQWSPESTAGGLARPGGYNDGDLVIRGFGLTHLSGAGCVAFENFPFMPTIRPVRTAPQPNGSPYSDRFVPSSEHASPGYYGVRLKSGIGVQLTVTPRTGFGKFNFPSSARVSILLDASAGAGSTSNIDGAINATVQIRGQNEITGSVTGGHFCGLPNTYTLYFAARFDRPFRSSGVWQGSRLGRGVRAGHGPHTGAFLTFDTRQNHIVRVKVGLSYVSSWNSLANLKAENPGWNFGTVYKEANNAWNRLLNRVQATGGTPSEERIFYTALYHSLLSPSIFSDANGQYIGFDNKVHSAGSHTQYANFSGWDIYRSEVQLLAWLTPQETSDMMQSLVADARQGGWLPKWPVANGYTGEMDGDSADPILADALAFGAHSFNSQAALRFMLKGATRTGIGPNGYLERPGLASYLRLGWAIPQTGGWGAAAETLEYSTDDFAIAQVARMLGSLSTYSRFMRRAHNWRQLFNPTSGFIQPRQDNSAFVPGFNPLSTSGFVEGNALQYLWMTPHDLPALFRLLGGNGAAVQRLNLLLSHFGQRPDGPYIWPGNEPAFEIPWEYDFAGQPWRTQSAVRRIITTLYTSARDGLPGNDDLGAMSSWYVWAAIGLYPEIPGVGGFALGSPLFPRIELQLSSGQTIEIKAPNAAPARPYVRSLLVNNQQYRSAWLPLSALNKHAALVFDLSSKPSAKPGHSVP